MLNNHNTKTLTFVGITTFAIVFSFITSQSKYSQLYASECCVRKCATLTSGAKKTAEENKAVITKEQQDSNNSHENNSSDVQMDCESNSLPQNINREILNDSFSMGRQFLLTSQKSWGNFNCEYNFIDQCYTYKDEQIKQALTLWGLTLIHRDNPTKETFTAVKKGLAFFDRHSLETKDGRKYVDYPGEGKGKTGTVSLVVLSLIEFLSAENPQKLSDKYEKDLNKYIEFLISLRMDNGQFHKYYHLKDGRGYGGPKPQADGETLLALVKAAKYKDSLQLRDILSTSADMMYQQYVQIYSTPKADSEITEKFFPWGPLAFFEIYASNWQESEKYANRLIALADWIIDVHAVSKRKKNTAYALEGLVPAWEVARLTKNEFAKNKIGYVIDQILYKLTTWQMGGALQNKFLKKKHDNDPRSFGGIMNNQEDKLLRTNITHHQMHAVIQARKYIYTR